METKENLNIYSERVLNVDQALDVMLKGGSLDMATVDNLSEVEKFNIARLDQILLSPTKVGDVQEYHAGRSGIWFVPEKYLDINVLEFLLEKCDREEERTRVTLEYGLFEERNLVILLKFFIYMVDHFRENNIMWGVGRGSSVSSYVLYLIGVHRIDSIKYNLDLTEFFK